MLDFWQGLSSSYDLQILSIKWRKSRFPRVQNKTRLALRALFQCGIELLCFINRIKQPQPSPSIAAVPCRAQVGFVAHLQKSQQKIRIRSLSPQQLPQLSSLASQGYRSRSRRAPWQKVPGGPAKTKWSWIVALNMEFPKWWLKEEKLKSRKRQRGVRGLWEPRLSCGSGFQPWEGVGAQSWAAEPWAAPWDHLPALQILQAPVLWR